MAENKKKILILTSDAGFGHRSASNALKTALSQKYPNQCEVAIVNPLDDPRTPAFLRESEEDYIRLIQKAPEIYRLGYKASDNEIPSTIIENLLILALYEVMGEIVRTHLPDAIVSTYPMYQGALRAYFDLNGVCVPLIVVVTDLISVHRLWFETGVDLCLVPTEEVKKLALENGMKAEKIRISGIPVSPQLTKNKHSKEDLRQSLGWETDLSTFLAVGSRSVDRLVETLRVVNHFGLPLQIAVTAGKDRALLDKLHATDWHIPAHIYGYVDNMPDMMLAADAIICKAGGLVVTESLAAGLPIMLIDVIPGQEEGNRDYVVQNGAGVMAAKPMEVLETLAHWMRDGRKGLQKEAENARRIGRPQAAIDAADLIWEAALRGPGGKGPISDIRRTRLIDLLTRNKINWESKKK